MRNIIKIVLLSVVVVFQSCVGNDTTFSDDADGVFYGNLTVGDYTERVGISVTETSDTTVDVFFDNVKFARAMPVRIDITVKEVQSWKNEDVLSFSATDIDPYVNKEPDRQPSYRFADMEGVVTGNSLVLSARMADGLKPSLAGKKFSFSGTSK